MSPKTRKPPPVTVPSNRTRKSASNRKASEKLLERIFLEKWLAQRRLEAQAPAAAPAAQAQPVKHERPQDSSVTDAQKKAIQDAYLQELLKAPKPEYKDEDEDY